MLREPGLRACHYRNDACWWLLSQPVKAVVADTLYNIIERKVKRRVPKLDNGKIVLDSAGKPVMEKREVRRIQLVSVGRDAQRTAEANLGITSSRQRRRHRMSRVRNAAVTWQL